VHVFVFMFVCACVLANVCVRMAVKMELTGKAILKCHMSSLYYSKGEKSFT